MSRFISIGLSPNLTSADIFQAIKILLRPDKWFDDETVEELRKNFADLIGIDPALVFSTISGRSALLSALKAFGIRQGDEVLVQGFTCVAVINPILWVKAQPVYIDIEKETLNMNINDLKKKITPRSKVVVIQHTFGLPFNQWDQLSELASQHKLVVIEDCAHALGSKINNRSTGTFGDAAIFSFGRDKMISSVFGGVLTLNQSQNKHRMFVKAIDQVDRNWILKQLLHPILTGIFLPTYDLLSIGKIGHFLSQRIGILPKATSEQEKMCGEMPNWIEKKYPGALAKLALAQLARLKVTNEKRAQIARLYQEAGIECVQKVDDSNVQRVWLRYPVLVNNPQKAHTFFKAHKIIIGDWYDQVIAPKEVDLDKTGYKSGMTLIAEEIAKEIINLPVHPRMEIEDAKRIVEVWRKYLEQV